MNAFEEAKDIMKKIGCEKAYAVYNMKLNNIAEVKEYNESSECLELEKKVDELTPTLHEKLILNPEKPIICPFNSSMDKYFEFSLRKREITYCNINNVEYESIYKMIKSILEKYNWSINKK